MQPIGVLVLGESGSGKSYSTQTLPIEETKILSVMKPILPYRKKVDMVFTPTAKDVIREMHNTDKKIIVIDDFQYILGVPMMARIGEKGWDKYNEIEQGYSDILAEINTLPQNTIIILTSHTETTDDGKTKIKTIGKALDKYLTVEGLFMIVLGTQVIDGKYYFITQNNGANTLKSPEGMFPSTYIPNDLAYVVDKIRNYYYMDDAKSDTEIAKEDQQNTISEEEVKPKRRHRNAGAERADAVVDEEKKKTEEDFAASQKILDEKFPNQEEVDFDEAAKTIEEELPKRKKREETETNIEQPEVPAETEAPRRRRRRRED